MIWNIVTDTSSDLKNFVIDYNDDTIFFNAVPFIISVENKDYVDDESLDVNEMLTAMENSSKISKTACPSPESFYQQFIKEGNVICITISKNLSGSYNSALVAKDNVLEENPSKNIDVINSISAGPSLTILVENIIENIKAGDSFEEVTRKAHEDVYNCRIIFALSSYDNLIKNGRMSKITGFIAQKLGFWGIGIGSDIGTIIIKDKCRGTKKAVSSIIKDMEERRIPTKKILINHCYADETALAIKSACEARFPGLEVRIMKTRGLCAFYAERNGLLVAYI